MKIQDVKVVYICPDHNEKYKKRKQHMQTLLKRIGFKDIVHFKSSSVNYPLCLTLATIEILKKYMDEPILLLEDDIEFTGVDNFDYVEDADAIYFGIGKSGGHPKENIHRGNAIFINYSPNQVKVHNMLTAHAILYISRRYKSAVIQRLQENINTFNDVVISRVQPHFKVLANKIPSFYQSSKFNDDNGWVESQTRYILK
uniref:Glycosyltransferase n=1 Tax=viral metagenome TaxID=1070528 RepID=A0A6C0IIH0_9ZZZZ